MHRAVRRDRFSRFLRFMLIRIRKTFRWSWFLWLVRSVLVRRILLALGTALVAAAFLFSAGVTKALSTPIIDMGLDPQRAALIAALLLTAGVALISALVSRQRLSAIVGAGLAYIIGYLLPFIHQERLPVYDPGGHIETLNTGALQHTVITLLAGGLLSAFLGAAVGSALGEVMLDPIGLLAQLDPIGRLAQLIRQERIHPDHIQRPEQLIALGGAQKRSWWHLIWAWTGLLAMVGIFLLSGGIGDFLLFSPDVGLHNPPVVNAHGTVVADSMISPALHGQRRSFLVYLPPSYHDPAARNRRYPTLYLLHGSPGSEYDWIKAGEAVQSADTLIAHGEIPELIMVFPDGNGQSGETSEWGNSFDHKQLMENFIAFDLVHYIDQKYRTIPRAGDRAIGGNSMGGFGAMNIAVHHPDIFGSVISLGGYFKAEGKIWGQNEAYIQANSPALVLPGDPKAWKLRIFLGAATKDQPYCADTQQFSQELNALHVTYTFDLENGYHAWSIWVVQLYHALTWLSWE